MVKKEVVGISIRNANPKAYRPENNNSNAVKEIASNTLERGCYITILLPYFPCFIADFPFNGIRLNVSWITVVVVALLFVSVSVSV